MSSSIYSFFYFSFQVHVAYRKQNKMNTASLGKLSVLLLLILCLVSTSRITTTAGAAPTEAYRHGSRSALTRYAQRLTAAVSLLSDGDDDGGDGTTATGANGGARGGRSPSSAVGNTPVWASVPHQASGFLRSWSAETARRGMRILQVALGAPVGAATERALEARIAAALERGEHAESVVAESPATAAAVGVVEGFPDVQAGREAATLATPADDSTLSLLAAMCRDSPVILPLSTARFVCAGVEGEVGVMDYVLVLTEAERQDCVPTEAAAANASCLCALDAYRDMDGRCQERSTDVVPTLEAGGAPCVDAASESVGLGSGVAGEYCAEAARDATLTLSLSLRISLMSDDELRAVLGRNRVAPSLPADGMFVVVSPAAPLVGSYSALAASMFDYDVLRLPADYNGTSSDGAYPLALRSSHRLVNGDLTTTVFCFTAPGNTLVQSESLQPRLAEVAGGLPLRYNVSLPLSEVGDALVEGGQLYIEAGVTAASIPFLHRVIRLHVAFPDVTPPRRYRYSLPLDPLYVAVIALVVAVVVGIACAIVWHYCTRESDPEDTLVTAAHRRKKFETAGVPTGTQDVQ